MPMYAGGYGFGGGGGMSQMRGGGGNNNPGTGGIDCNHIAHGIYLGGHTCLHAAEPLLRLGIKNVVNTALEFVTETPESVNWADLQRNGIEVHNTMWDDTLAQKIYPSQSMETAINYIDSVLQQRRNVLVNCAMGRSRSTSLVIAYLMTRQNMSFDESLAMVKRSRPQAGPNPNFEGQLRQLEASLRGGGGPASPVHSPRNRFSSPHAGGHGHGGMSPHYNPQSPHMRATSPHAAQMRATSPAGRFGGGMDYSSPNFGAPQSPHSPHSGYPPVSPRGYGGEGQGWGGYGRNAGGFASPNGGNFGSPTGRPLPSMWTAHGQGAQGGGYNSNQFDHLRRHLSH